MIKRSHMIAALLASSALNRTEMPRSAPPVKVRTKNPKNKLDQQLMMNAENKRKRRLERNKRVNLS